MYRTLRPQNSVLLLETEIKSPLSDRNALRDNLYDGVIVQEADCTTQQYQVDGQRCPVETPARAAGEQQGGGWCVRVSALHTGGPLPAPRSSPQSQCAKRKLRLSRKLGHGVAGCYDGDRDAAAAGDGC